jgi:hypothetical protein
MRGPRGGYIGFNRVPAASAANSAASGVWTLREAEAMRRAGTWPSAPTVPGTPTSLSATSGNAQVSLAWTAPASDGGAAITDYAVQFSSDSGSTWSTFADGTSTTTSATVTGLTNGTAYVFRVAATNSAGTGAYTAASSSVTPSAASVPGVPTSVRRGSLYWSCQPNDNAIAWDAPVSDGGSTITGYLWRIGSGGATTLVSPASGNDGAGGNYTGGRVLGLPTGGSFQVAAVNAVGTGSYASITLQQDCN